MQDPTSVAAAGLGLSSASLLLVAAFGSRPDARGDPPVDFQSEIRPLLSDRCFPCHGPDPAARRREGGFRLDVFEEATGDLGGYAAIVPGHPEESEALRRLRSLDPLVRMPPPDSKLAVSPEEVARIERWIQQGAPYRRHWAFVPPRRSEPPEVRDAAWPRDELDRFVLAALEEAGLAPAAEAERATLIRRAALVLTGLPPAPEEVDAFAANPDADAFEQVVDRLLASARFGERMALDWMDLSRYADTYGYQSDVERRVWPWRDWVVEAFNANLPFDQFATWQLAGDLLPEPTRAQRLATAFNRLHRQTNEGGSVEEEMRVEYVSDRVHTFGMAFLGLTLECARCHDHKFDPIAQEEYYALSAFFGNIDESGLYSHFTSAVPTPTLLLTTPEQDARIEALRRAIARSEQELIAPAPERRGAFEGWLESGLREPLLPGCTGSWTFDSIDEGALANGARPDLPGNVVDGPALAPGRAGGALSFSGEDAAVFPGVGEVQRYDPFTFALWLSTPDLKERAVVLHRSRAWTDAGSRGYELLLEDGRPSFALVHFWPGNALRVRAREPLPSGAWTHVAVTYDGSSRGEGLRLYVDGRAVAGETVRDQLTRQITGGGEGALTLGQRFRDRGFAGGQVDDLRVFERELAPLEVAELCDGESLGALLGKPRGEWTSDQADQAFACWLAAHDPEQAGRRESLRELRRELCELLDAIPEIMTMQETPQPRPAYVLKRGSYLARGGQVEPRTPAEVLAFQGDLPRDRLGLARWLFDARNPLTARVAVNRLWQTVFGRGLVETPENFGSQGTPPTHPELLDTLALDFVASGWDVKAMLLRLVLSACWRQDSRASDGARRVDPDNRLLSHAPSYRLSAETLRDGALQASGLLVEELGGPSVKPYQPEGLWEEKSGLAYVPDEGAGLWRRSLYTFWKRTSPPPAMTLFDATSREVCSARRTTTSTPLQALALLNDVQLVEASVELAERVLREVGPGTDARVARAFRLLASREPTARELELLSALYSEQLEAFAGAPDEARAFAQAGKSTRDEALDRREVAALGVVASTLMVCDAVVTLR